MDELEQKYPGFQGLNLSWELREGLAKHETGFDAPGENPGFRMRNSGLEAQVANLADEIAYYSHDLDDGLETGLLSEKQLLRDVRVWRSAAAWVKRNHGTLPDECRRFFTIRCIIEAQVSDVIKTTEAAIKAAGVQSADGVRALAKPLVRYSPDRKILNLELRKYLYQNLYYSPAVHEPNNRAVRMLEQLFRFFLQHPDQIGEQSQRRVKTEGLHRAVCDYIAGMTDRYAMKEYQRLFGLAWIPMGEVPVSDV